MDIPIDSLKALIIGYAIGSIPFGLLLTRFAGLGDVRNIGSGNIGATNVLRTGNKGLAAATLAFDLLKGFLPVYLAWQWFGHPGGMPEAAWGAVPLAALGAVLGHCFPVWLGFKGGKGVATNAGVTLGIAWPLGLIYALLWLTLLGATRISSLAGMGAVCGALFVAVYWEFEPFVPVLAIVTVIVLWLHRTNIQRLLRGEEPKVGGKK